MSTVTPETGLNSNGSSPQEISRNIQSQTDKKVSNFQLDTSKIKANIIPSPSALTNVNAFKSILSSNDLSKLFGGAGIPELNKIHQDDTGPRSVIFDNKIYKCEIFDGKNTINLIDMMVSVSISESISGNIIGGAEFVSDGSGILETAFPASGSKPFNFEWGMPLSDGSIFKKYASCFIYECSVIQSSDPHRNVYRVSFFSTETLRDLNITISKAYVKKSVREIILDVLGVYGTLKSIPEIVLDPEDETNVIEHYVTSGFKSPTEVINNILTTYCKKTYNFFQRLTNTGQQYVVYPIYKKTETGLDYTSKARANTEYHTTDVKDKYIFTTCTMKDSNRLDEIISDGVLASRVIVASPIRKRVLFENYDRQADKSPVTNNSNDVGFSPYDVNVSKTDTIYPNPDNKIFIIPDVSFSPTDVLNTAFKQFQGRGKNRISPVSNAGALKYHATLPGNIGLYPASTIFVTFPSNIELTSHKQLTGLWYITSITHKFGRSIGYTMTMEICRDQVSDAYGIIPPIPEISKSAVSPYESTILKTR